MARSNREPRGGGALKYGFKQVFVADAAGMWEQNLNWDCEQSPARICGFCNEAGNPATHSTELCYLRHFRRCFHQQRWNSSVFAGIHRGFAGIHCGFAGIHRGFAGIHRGFAEIHRGFAGIHRGFAEIRRGFAEIHRRFVAIQQRRSAEIHRRFAGFRRRSAGFYRRFA